MSLQKIPFITQEEYNALYDAEGIFLIEDEDYQYKKRSILLDKICSHGRFDDGVHVYLLSRIYDHTDLVSFKMEIFKVENETEIEFFERMHRYLKVNFYFPYTDIEILKEDIKESADTEHFMIFIANPRIYRYKYGPYEDIYPHRNISTAHVKIVKNNKELTLKYVAAINQFFKDITGEYLFFRF